MIRRNVPIRVVEEEAVARIGHHIHALTCLGDVLADLSFVHKYWSFPDWLCNEYPVLDCRLIVTLKRSSF
jgi:hypothetical protein